MLANSIRLSAVALSLGLALAAAPAHADRPALSIYGFARLDLIVDDSQTSDIRQPLHVASEPDPAPGGAFSIHPRLSRIGLTMDEWEPIDNLDSRGKFEIDFHGAAQNMAIRVRHAYFTLELFDIATLLVGQTWDLYSPLFPAANNETLMWHAGNTGDRRPQLQLTVMPFDRLRIALALGQGGGMESLLGDADNDLNGVVDTAERGGEMLQWLVEYRERWWTRTPARIGIWGHAGQDRWDDGSEYTSWSVGAHLFLPLSRRLTMLGEFFYGRNLDDIRGGTGQGINPVTLATIGAVGGWLELAYTPTRRHMIALGGTMDNPRSADLEDGQRDSNAAGYLVTRYRPSDAFQLGLEYTYWRTDYKNAPVGDDNRVNLHLTLFF